MTSCSGRAWWALAAAVAVVLAVASASPHGDGGLVGARKLAQAHDCRGVVAFSGVAARPSIKVAEGGEEVDTTKLGTKLGFRDLVTDKSVGWSRESGEFTCVCPGLYQFAFSAAGPGTRLTLRKKEASSGSEAASPWKAIVSTEDGGGAHVVLLEMDVGDVVAVWLTKGDLPPEGEEDPRSSFSGYRLAKK